jgi:hypothetical protein
MNNDNGLKFENGVLVATENLKTTKTCPQCQKAFTETLVLANSSQHDYNGHCWICSGDLAGAQWIMRNAVDFATRYNSADRLNAFIDGNYYRLNNRSYLDTYSL